VIREQIAAEFGLLVPPVRIKDDMMLRPGAYMVRLRGARIAEGHLHPSRMMAIATRDGLDDLPGTEVTEPAFGLPAWWIDREQRTLAEARGYTVVEPEVVLATHLSELIKAHAPELITREDVQMMLDELRHTNPAAVNELVPEMASVGQVHQVLQGLLDEGVPISDMSTIVEALADGLRMTGDLATAGEHVRVALSRIICEQFRDGDTLTTFILDAQLEAMIAEAIVDTPAGPTCLLDPQALQAMLRSVQSAVEELAADAAEPVVLTSPPVRRHVRALIGRSFPDVAVLSHAEIVNELTVQARGSIALDTQMAEVPV
jgi:flagellar biosynthesis protein FlhA